MRKIEAVIVYPDDSKVYCAHVAVEHPRLEVWQEYVGGTIQVVQAGDVVLIVNEEGKVRNLPMNTRATGYWWHLEPHMYGMDSLVGTVVVLSDGLDDFESVPQSTLDYFDLS